MDLLLLIAMLSVFSMMILVTTGIWAIYWATVRGFQQTVIGLQAIHDQRRGST